MEKLNEKMDSMDSEAVDRLKTNLRDSYMQMKDLSSRCMIDLSNIERNDRRIFYFKPESVLLKDMDTQKTFRDNLIKSVSEPPKIIEPLNLAEKLNKEETETVLRDLSEPDDVRVKLAAYFERRSYTL